MDIDVAFIKYIINKKRNYYNIAVNNQINRIQSTALLT